MTPEQITRGLYNWLTASARINGMPMGTRLCTWDEMIACDPHLVESWRSGVRAFLDGIGATEDDDEHLNFTGALLVALPPPLASDDDRGDEHRITPDGG